MRRQFLLCLMMAAALLGTTSCNDKTDEYDDPGTSSIISLEGPSTAFMGDSIAFTFEITSEVVRTNQTKVQLYFGETMVSERMMLTPNAGKYTGKILVPFMKNVVDGEVTVKVRTQNERFANYVVEKKVQITRPQFSKLVLKDSQGRSLEMLPVAGQPYTYAVTANFPSEMYAVIEIPKYGENGNVMTFGDVDGKISNGSTEEINFSAKLDGNYEVTFNTLTYVGTPFVPFAMNDIEFTKVNDTTYKIEENFTQGGDINITGLKLDYPNYWVNPTYFDIVKDTNGKLLRFRGKTGKYRLTVDKSLKYFKVEAMNGSALADLTKGDDVLWCNGDGNIGFPSYSKNKINWNADNAVCLMPVGNGRHELVLRKGTTINTVNYKFYGQRGWGGEFTSDKISIGEGCPWFKVNTVSGSNGNIIAGDTALKNEYFYRVTVDISAGSTKAKLYAVELASIPEVE